MTRDISVARRDVIMGVGFGVGIASGMLPASRAPAQSLAAAAGAPAGDVWSQEYQAKKGDVSLSMFRKRLGAPVSGAIRAGAFAEKHPDRVDRLVLSAFIYKGTGSPTLEQRAERLECYRTHNRRLRDRNMIRSIFARDGLASSYDPAVAGALADEELKFGDQVPTGTYLAMTANLPLVDPTKALCPVMLVRGFLTTPASS